MFDLKSVLSYLIIKLVITHYMGCCNSKDDVIEEDQTRPLLGQTSAGYQSSEEINRDMSHPSEDKLNKQGPPVWSAELALQAIDRRLEKSMLDISILDPHTLMSRRRSFMPPTHVYDDSPPSSPCFERINKVRRPRVKLRGPPNALEALAKPLPSREENEWVRRTAVEFLEILDSELDRKLTPDTPLFHALPLPPKLLQPK